MWFKSTGKSYQTRINAILRSFYEDHKKTYPNIRGRSTPPGRLRKRTQEYTSFVIFISYIRPCPVLVLYFSCRLNSASSAHGASHPCQFLQRLLQGPRRFFRFSRGNSIP
ncbi:MAG TPA: hypothetical protein ENI06_10575 [Spirochaetales bacterium]|nr:hypothetical protein [Spirochaetales bacterium]